MVEVRDTLSKWGAYWYEREKDGLGYAAVGPGQRLIDLAKLGCRIQRSGKHDRSDDIIPPPHIAMVDKAISRLDLREKAALTAYYIRCRSLPRRRVKSRVLLLAEKQVMHEL
jgi:hypothetical protein